MSGPAEVAGQARDAATGRTQEESAPGTSLAVSATRSTLWNVFSQVLSTLIGLASAGLLTVWLRPTDYGIFGMASTVVTFFGVFGDGGLSFALIRGPRLGPVEETTGFTMGMIGGAGLSLAALAAAPVMGFYFGSREVGVMAAVLAANFFLMAPSRPSFAHLARELRFRALSVVAIVAAVIASACGIVAASRGAGGWSLAISTLVAPAIMTFMYVLAAPIRVVPRQFSRPLARELSAFGANLSGFALAIAVAWFPITFLLGRVAGATAVGLLSMGMKLVALSTQKVGTAFSSVFLPSIMRVPPAERSRSYVIALRTLAICIAPIAWGVFAVADELVAVLSPSWAQLAPTLKGFAVGASVEPLASLPIAWLMAQGRSGTLLRLGLFMIPLAWIGYGAAAWFGTLQAFVAAWTIISAVNVVVFLVVPAENARQRIAVLRAPIRPLLAAMLMAAGVELMQRLTGTANHRWGLAVGIVTGVPLYAGLAHLLLREDFARTRRLVLSSVRRQRG
ncbi:MAG: oligosaccharide flippase family protein [Polyangia bacterium]